MARTHRNLILMTICLVGGALLLAACGRKGPLDLPPAAAVQPAGNGQAEGGAASAQRAAQPVEYGPDGRPLAPRGPKRQLPIDWLID